MVILHMIQKLPPCLALVLAPRVITLQTLLELRTLIIWWLWVIHKDSLRLWWSLCVILLLFLLAQLPRSGAGQLALAGWLARVSGPGILISLIFSSLPPMHSSLPPKY